MKKSYTNDPVRLWYLPMILGLILIGLGVWVLATPVEFFITLSLLFAFSFIATGILDVIHGISSKHCMPNWAWLIAGVLLLSRPQISMIILPFFVGFGICFARLCQSLGRLSLKNWVARIGVGC